MKNHHPLEPWNPRILDPFLKVASLYIHIPFCVKKCAYCDFFSVPYDESSALAYTDALCKELYLKSDSAAELKTVYIGGGTPSLLPEWKGESPKMPGSHTESRLRPSADS